MTRDELLAQAPARVVSPRTPPPPYVGGPTLGSTPEGLAAAGPPGAYPAYPPSAGASYASYAASPYARGASPAPSYGAAPGAPPSTPPPAAPARELDYWRTQSLELRDAFEDERRRCEQHRRARADGERDCAAKLRDHDARIRSVMRDVEQAKRDAAKELADRDATHAATLLKLRERCAAWLRKVKAEWSKNAKRALAKQKLKLDARHEATNAKTAKRWQRALDAALSGGRVAAAAARPASSAYPRHARKPECAAAAAPDSDDDATLGDEPFPDDDPFDDGLRATMAATFKLYPDPIPV